ncbi:TIGR04222 domain-containing membrane protein [Myxococcus sp. K15C18031901]|uniref:TIGR04222 domain-containing membrane protein n=1 Tax=Myxococcus dinghuensis TaxID=2906761 RepID=UPI0020A79D37|nr:TIGR04222 domain-containing membrane protein [Myxococcus dinghuensis]MCP3101679.1 TIGR04222 domain-containing membrane protein [Myxococcus dinghuensis]
MNPTHRISGPEFLLYAVAAFIGCIILGVVLNRLLRRGTRHDTHRDEDLPRRPDPYLVATLAGPSSIIETALARLLHQGAIRLDPGRLETAAGLPAGAPRIERAVYHAVSQGVMETAKLERAADASIESLKQPLVERGWLLDENQAFFSRWIPALPLVILMMALVARMVHGLSRDKPVGFLGLLLVGCAIVLFIRVRPSWRTLHGDAVLARFRDQQEPVKLAAQSASSLGALGLDDLAVSVGLYGLGTVAVADFQLLNRHLNVHSASDSSGSSGDGGGSCGGGGGGCGGGGCGGCS